MSFNEKIRKYVLKEYVAEPDHNKEKFFVNFPYPYINGYLHIGHLFTALKADIIARFMRLRGKNVLLAQGFHATGQPIAAAAERIKEGEPKQIEMLKKMGVKEIEKFKDAKYWVEFFSKAAKEDLMAIGYSADWRRSFITTELNPPYDAFVKWQYNKLYERGFIYKGKHPVVYCPKCKHALGDHDRSEGEGIVPEEVSLIKFELEPKVYLMAMTFRPETTWGVTNLWINKEAVYKVYKVGDEKWILSKEGVESLKNQGIKGKEIAKIKGEELLEKEVKNLINGKKVKIYHGDFVDISKGTGIVMSVPAHAPYDYAALLDLKREGKGQEIELISLISLQGYGDFPAKEIVEKAGVKSSKEKEVLDALTKEIYKKEFHEGRLKSIFGKELEGLKVSEAKQKIIDILERKGIRVKYYILPEKVVCRCLTPAIVKVLEDQWFIKYSDKEWKNKVKEHIKEMKFYPENLRSVFLDAVDWLGDWAFTRDRGLGTRFPKDPSKLIESLSDSTIYMAYYTIAKYLENAEKYNIDVKKLNDKFFDYIFLGKGDIKNIALELGISEELLKEMKEEFEYWYDKGFEIRVSGKDLIKNHLTMMLFHHLAIFGKEKSPKGIAVNGYVMVEGEKMSKSKGNFYTIRDAIERFGIEEIRALAAYAGDVGLDDANYELSAAKSITQRMEWFAKVVNEYYKKGEKIREIRQEDAWALKELSRIVFKVGEYYENLMTKSAFQVAFFEIHNLIKRYLRRSVGRVNQSVMDELLKVATILISPILPHFAEYVWKEVMKEKGCVDDLEFPEYEIEDKSEIEEFEEYLEDLLKDIREIIKIVKVRPKKITIIIAEPWKYKMYELIKGAGTRNIKDLISLMKQQDFFKGREKEVIGLINKIIKLKEYEYLSKDSEILKLYEAKKYIEKEFNANLEITENHEKSNKALPFKPAIVVE